mmetsp:Transcript_60037/g.70145  ORF Transcript_60037/g.70145 Transcript_60037/m.70145 type:complete len:368 (+) Transcript_60037:38-1141(+)
MSAAVARRKKQLLIKKQKAAEAASSGGSATEYDALTVRLNSLLDIPDGTDKAEAETRAYEALQLAQGQVRRYAKQIDGDNAFKLASSITIQLLSRGYIGMANQLSTQMIDAMTETRLTLTDGILDKLCEVDSGYKTALAAITPKTPEEEDEKFRLQKLLMTFLRKAIKYSDDLGTIRYGDMRLHSRLGQCAWDMEEYLEAMMEFALAEENPETVVDLLFQLPKGDNDNAAKGPVSLRDSLLTHGVVIFISLENLRDANSLLRAFVAKDTERDAQKLATNYMMKGKKHPTHVAFCGSLIRICETDAAPLFSWILKSFNVELNRHPDLKPYTAKIGRLYFNIQPPPNMLNMMENMMTMMSAGGGMGGGM